MKINKKFFIVGAVLAVLVFFYLKNYPERAIKVTINNISKNLTINEKLHPIEIVGRTKKISKYLADTLKITWKFYDQTEFKAFDIAEVKEKLMVGLGPFDLLENKPEIIDIKLNQGFANVSMKASALGSSVGDAGKFFEHHLITLRFEKLAGKWKLAEITQVRNLRE